MLGDAVFCVLDDIFLPVSQLSSENSAPVNMGMAPCCPESKTPVSAKESEPLSTEMLTWDSQLILWWCPLITSLEQFLRANWVTIYQTIVLTNFPNKTYFLAFRLCFCVFFPSQQTQEKNQQYTFSLHKSISDLIYGVKENVPFEIQNPFMFLLMLRTVLISKKKEDTLWYDFSVQRESTIFLKTSSSIKVLML